LSNGTVPAPESAAELANARRRATVTDVIFSHDIKSQSYLEYKRKYHWKPNNTTNSSHSLDNDANDEKQNVRSNNCVKFRKSSFLRH